MYIDNIVIYIYIDLILYHLCQHISNTWVKFQDPSDNGIMLILLFPRHAILAPTFRDGTFHRTSKVWTPMNNQGELIHSLKPFGT